MNKSQKFYFGYSLVDNVIYFVRISLNISSNKNIININNKDYPINFESNYFKTKTEDFIYYFLIKQKNILGVVYGVYPINKKSIGYFTTNEITKEMFHTLNQLDSPYDYFNTKIIPKIYFPIKNIKNVVELNVMSFNVCSNFIWSGWKGITEVSKIIDYYKPDVILFQEIGKDNFDKLSNLNKIYFSNYNGGVFSKFEIVKVYKRFPFSPIYGVKIKIKNNLYLRIYNSHLTDQGYGDVTKSKKYQLPSLIYGLNNEIYNYNNDTEIPAILAGDHNTESHLDSINKYPVSIKLLNDGWIDSYREVNKIINKNIDFTWPVCNTFSNILEYEIENCNSNITPKTRIDYIYYRNGKNISLSSKESITIYNNKFPSDHKALLTKFSIIF